VFPDGAPLGNHHPTLLIKQATTQLLQSLTICAGVDADNAERAAIKTLSGLLRTLVDAGCSQALSESLVALCVQFSRPPPLGKCVVKVLV